ncbi:hypothetical protein QCA50_012522 [Cerrena zonata]|uniref:F-box domain-containing protein n=1 Tax=Cerrena zonata TaxID=2478898 RepID=A0AAW0G2Q2_9APHY
MSNSKKRVHDSIVGASGRDTSLDDRRNKRRAYNNTWEVKTATRNRYILPSPVPDPPLISSAWGWFWGRCSTFSCKLPIEICETIIDYVGELCNMEDLARCAHVCRAWVPRAQMHLFSFVDIWIHNKCSSVRYAVRRKPYLLKFINSFQADYDHVPRSTNLLTTYHMSNLKQCAIDHLSSDMTHSSLYSKFPSSATSLRRLVLDSCKIEDVNQLCRFLTSFRSLSILILSWYHRTNGTNDSGYSHLQFNRSKCSLQTLAIGFIPNISMLLRSLIKARPFVTHLKHLIFSYHHDHHISPSPVRRIAELLQHCSHSLEEITIILGSFFGMPLLNGESV